METVNEMVFIDGGIAHAIGEDEAARHAVETLLEKISPRFTGPLIVWCNATCEHYRAADRRTSVYIFLASWWKGKYQFKLLVEQDGEYTEVRDAVLLAVMTKEPRSYTIALSGQKH
jgi:hypothetical protein